MWVAVYRETTEKESIFDPFQEPKLRKIQSLIYKEEITSWISQISSIWFLQVCHEYVAEQGIELYELVKE